MERRLLLAIVLTFVVLTAYQWLVPTAQPAGYPDCRAGRAAARSAAAPATEAPASPLPSPAVAAAADRDGSSRYRRTHCHGRQRRRAGGVFEPWRHAHRVGAVDVHRPGRQAGRSRAARRSANQPKPFSLRLDDAAKTARLNSALFASAVERRRSTPRARP